MPWNDEMSVISLNAGKGSHDGNLKKVLPVIFVLRSVFLQFSSPLIVEATLYSQDRRSEPSHSDQSTPQNLWPEGRHLKYNFYNLAWTLWREESIFLVFVCLLLISVKASFVLVTQNTTGNPWMIHRCTALISFFHLLLLIFAHNRTHKQTHNTSGFSHSVDKDSLSSLCLTCKHTRSEMSISRLIPSLFSLRAASLTPHLSQ